MGQTTSGSAKPRADQLSAIVDHRMLVWGGQKETRGLCQPHDVIWTWNLLNSSWSKEKAHYERAEDLPHPSFGSRIAVYANRDIYHFGGRQRTISPFQFKWLDDLHKLDGPTLRWEHVPANGIVPIQRSECGLCVLDNRLVMMGGIRNDHVLDDFWMFSLLRRILASS
eukprot:m.188023 g.188023  ORF g.188023 m.188023 type:complete len:168 (+) comp39372_c0_seq40:116-619(+)